MKKQYEYFAFISYSSKDKKLAKWVHRTLQRFNLPAKFQTAPPAPKRPENFRPLFRDLENLRCKNLTEAIFEALDKSRYLIVICSQNSAVENDQGEHWVNKEIKHFLTQPDNPEERVILLMHRPFLHSLIRNKQFQEKYKVELSNNKQSFKTNLWQRINKRFEKPKSKLCMPPALRELKKNGESYPILASDIQQKGRSKAIVAVIARMLDMDPDAIWNTYGRYLRRIQILKFTLSLLVIGAAGLACDYCIPKVEYYQDYVERYNEPVGIGKLHPNQLQNRDFHFKITRQFWKVKKIECLDKHGFLYPQVTNKYPKIVYEHARGSAPKAIHYNAGHQLIGIREFTRRNNQECWMNFTSIERGNASAASAINLMGDQYAEMEISQAGIHSQLITYDKAGFIWKKTYHNALGDARPDGGGVWGELYIRNEQGQPTHIINIDRDGNKINSHDGICETILDYENSNLVLMKYLDKDGNKKSRHNVHSIIYSWDDNGNMTEIKYVDQSGNLVNHEKDGCAKKVFSTQLDPKDNNIWYKGTSFYNECPKLMYTSISAFQVKGDEITGRVRIKLPLLDNGWHFRDDKYFFEFGRHRNIAKGYMKSFDDVGSLHRHWILSTNRLNLPHTPFIPESTEINHYFDEKGVEICKIEQRDASHQESEVRYTNPRDYKVLVSGPDEYSIKRTKYDSVTGLPCEYSHYDTNNSICEDSKGCAKTIISYEWISNGEYIITYSNYSLNEKKSIKSLPDNIIRQISKDGRLVKTEKIVKNERTYELYEEIANGMTLCNTYNSDDKLIMRQYRKNGRFCEGPEGYASLSREYNEQGKLLYEFYHDSDRKLCAGPEGYARVECQYDSNGNLLGQGYSNEENIRRDAKGIPVEITYVDKEGVRCSLPDGTYRRVLRYDELGNPVQQECYNVKEELIKRE